MALDLKKTYATDKEKEIEGVWEDFGDGCRIKIARAGNPNYEKEFQRLIKPHRKALRRNSLSNDVAKELYAKCMARAIVLDWEGLEEDGKDIPYSVENAERILLQYPDLSQHIQEISESAETFRQELVEDSEKN